MWKGALGKSVVLGLWATLVVGLLIASGEAQVTEAKPTDAVLQGQVTDALGVGIEGVAVKLFRDGFLVTETTTDMDGNYELRFQYRPELDKTIVVWFLPQETDLVPEIVVLRESYDSKERRLPSPCLPRIELAPDMSLDVELKDEKAKLDSLSESECSKGRRG